MYNLPQNPIDERAAEASLITGYSFQTRSLPPPMWGSVTAYGTDHVPWWIQKEMMEKKDRKIKRLETQVERYKKEIEQLGVQLKCYQAKNAMMTDDRRQSTVSTSVNDLENITARCTTSINTLDILIRRVEALQKDIVAVDTTPSTRFIVLKLNELEELVTP